MRLHRKDIRDFSIYDRSNYTFNICVSEILRVSLVHCYDSYIKWLYCWCQLYAKNYIWFLVFIFVFDIRFQYYVILSQAKR